MSGTENGRKPIEADAAKELWADLFVERLSAEARSGLTPAQLDDIRRVARDVAPGAHRVDWRFSLPLLGPLFGGRGLYGVLLAGPEKRSPVRRRQDRMMRRRRHAGARSNIQALAVGVSLTLLFVMVLVGALHAG